MSTSAVDPIRSVGEQPSIRRPGDGDWDEARSGCNLADQQPAAVALPRTADKVARAVRTAAGSGLRVTAQGSGHSASAHGSLADAMLIKTQNLRRVSVDPVARRAPVAAGTPWLETAKAAGKHGLAANSVTAVELVLADGRQRRVDPDDDPDLFWALRGGGGSFGVVQLPEHQGAVCAVADSRGDARPASRLGRRSCFIPVARYSVTGA